MNRAKLYRLIHLGGVVLIFLPAYIAGKHVVLASIAAIVWSLVWGTAVKREQAKTRAKGLRLVVKGQK